MGRGEQQGKDAVVDAQLPRRQQGRRKLERNERAARCGAIEGGKHPRHAKMHRDVKGSSHVS